MRYFFMRPYVVAGFLACAASAFGAVAVMDEIVCKVNGDIITRTDLMRDETQLQQALQQQGLAGTRLEDAVKSKMSDLLRDRIDRLLLVQKAKDLDLKVDSDLNKEMADVQRKSGISDPEKFQEWIREQSGMPYADFKNERKNDLLTQAVIREEVARKIQFKTEQLKAYYDAHKSEFERTERIFLSQIVISTDGKNAAGIAAAEKKAKDLVARARKGEKFSDLAQGNSDDKVTAQEGGALDPYAKGAMDPELEAQVWDKPRGYVTDPIKRPFGFLILRVDDHQQAGLAPFEEVQQDIQNKLFQPRLQPALRGYLTMLRQEAFLEIKPGFQDSGAAPGKDTAWMNPAQLKPETVTKAEVAGKPRHKRLLKLIPLPGTVASSGTSSSR
jgi:peptidyl-prolyl cis-trans isomerase SurA